MDQAQSENGILATVATKSSRVILNSVAGRRRATWTWRIKPRTKVRILMKSGVHVQAAVACGITNKGPWRSAKTPGINQALSLDYLKSEGLYSLRDGWIALHYPK